MGRVGDLKIIDRFAPVITWLATRLHPYQKRPMADHRDTLILPFTSGALPLPDGHPVGFLNAEPLGDAYDEFPVSSLVAEQGFRPSYLALEALGTQVHAEIDWAEASPWQTILVLAHRNRQVNQINLTRAWNALGQGGMLVFCGAKNQGVQPLRKWAQKRCALAGSLSKHHAIAFWMEKRGDNWDFDPVPEADHGYDIGPGMFSAKGPDTGSMVLVPHLKEKLKGFGADFGAGWGYLSDQALKTNDSITGVDLFEADHASLQAARQNLADQSVDLNFHWCDMVSEAPTGRRYDWVIMNPPFHTGRAAEPALGNAFIKVASQTLKPGGRLLMVANVNLPYEAALEKNFRRHERIDQAKGFKVLEAYR